jgi:nucleoside-diphosphate-sugar epimerase
MTKSSRNVCVTAVDGNTGFAIAELLLTDSSFKSKIDSVSGLTLHPSASKAKESGNLGAKIVAHKPGREREMVKTLQTLGCDTICLIPPAHAEKYDITAELITAAKKAGVQNVLFISSVGADLAERNRQPRLREFIDLETLVLSSKGDVSSPLGHSPVVIRYV